MTYNCPLRAFCNGLFRVAPPKRGIFWRFQVHVYERVGISPVEVCDLKGLGNLSSRYNVKGLKMAYKRVLWLGKKVQRILDFSKKKNVCQAAWISQFQGTELLSIFPGAQPPCSLIFVFFNVSLGCVSIYFVLFQYCLL